MHKPRPHGRHSPGVDLSKEDEAAAELLVRRLTNLKGASGLESFKMVRTLPSGVIAIAQDAGGVLRLIIQDKQYPPEDDPFDGLAKENIPMLFSGAIHKSVVMPGDGVQINITQKTRQRLAGYKSNNMPNGRLTLQRFVIHYNARVQELKPKTNGPIIYTQYAAQRPSWYSGAMATVMQIVGGYGRQDFDDLPDNKLERARMIVPEKVMRKIRLEISNLRLPGYTGIPKANGEFQYDYKFNETNAVSFDSSGKPWLLKIERNGVFAMPLPLIQATTTTAFREYIEEVGDDEILWILNRFGGMPSGENFPVRIDNFQSWLRAGVIIKICDCSEFYEHIMYASACGWAVNDLGTEAFNTCYDYDEDEGLGFGLAYKMQFSLSAAENSGRLPTSFDLDSDENARKLDAYLSMLYRQLTANTARELAIKYKIRRVPIGQILSRLNNSGPSEVDYWDNLELSPIASHSAKMTQIGRGWLYNAAPFKSQPQIKFAEPFMQGCTSHNFLPLMNGIGKSSYPNSDTIMYGYYQGNSLVVVKYFRDSRYVESETIDNFEECMAVGAWERTETSGASSLLGHFYTSEIDERDTQAPITTVTKIVGSDLGYDTKPNFAFDHIFAMAGSMWRNRYFQHISTVKRTEGYGMSVAVCATYYNRNALFHAKKEWTSGSLLIESLSVGAVSDPNSYRFFTYDFLWAWVGGDYSGNVTTELEVDPYPKDGNPVWVTGYSHSPSQCSDFADQGDWVGGLPADYTWLVHPSRHEWQNSGGGGGPTVKPYSKTTNGKATEDGELVISISSGVKKVNKKPRIGYFMSSPSEFGDIFYADSIKLCAGDSEYQNCNEADPEAPKQRKRWGHTTMADNTTAQHFIGVINE